MAEGVGFEPTHNGFRDRRAAVTLALMARPLGFEPKSYGFGDRYATITPRPPILII